MEFAAYYRSWSQRERPGDWAAAREAEGWPALATGDHLSVLDQGCLHAFPVLAQMASATSRVQLYPAFANNLVRSPVEFAQLALTMQTLSDGRFEAGLGAGWSESEMVGAGIDFPPAPARARRFREAVLVVRDLLRGACRFEGEFYRVDLSEVGPRTGPPPPLFAALGGPWTLRNIGPLVDRIELFANAPGFRSGTMDFSVLRTVTDDDFRRLIATAREANPQAALGGGFFVAVGDGPYARSLAEGFGDGFCRGLAGPANQVAETLLRFGEEGLDRISVLAVSTADTEALAPLLLSC